MPRAESMVSWGCCSNGKLYNSSVSRIINYAKATRQIILESNYRSQEGHVPTSFSIVECLIAARKFLGGDEEFVKNFSLSKGHAAIGYFSFLTALGLVERKDMIQYARHGSKMGGHPVRSDKVLFTSGSLGHGLPMSVGYAHAKNSIENLNQKVICLVGDGELNEGSNWEAMLLAERFQLGSLYLIVDDNGSSAKATKTGNLIRKLQSFGFVVAKCDGHSVGDLQESLSELSLKSPTQPKALVAKTVKGKGIRQMESDPERWHHTAITKQELDLFLEELRE